LSDEQIRALERALRGASVIGGFEILEKVGQGGMGAVFRARQISMDRFVALKILPPKLAQNPQFKQRFLNEARTSAKLSHLNIINGIDCGEANGYTFFAMEFVDGKTVKQIMKARGEKEKGKYPPDEAFTIIRQICDALVYAKRMNMVHRDIKPDNIMVTDAGVAKLCDLGLAKQTESADDASMTQTGVAVGTPHYIAPEQAKGEKSVDFRSDLYSLGATFYHMLTGRTPFEGPNSAAVMALHISSEAKNPCDIDSNIPLGYGQIIAKLMAKAPADRYESPEELIEDLEAVKRGEVPHKAAAFKGKSSCHVPSFAKVHKGGRTTGPHAAVGTAKQTTHVTTPLKTPPVRTPAGKPKGLLIAAAGVGAVAVLVLMIVLGGSGGGDPKQTANAVPEPAKPQAEPAQTQKPVTPAQPEKPSKPEKEKEKTEAIEPAKPAPKTPEPAKPEPQPQPQPPAQPAPPVAQKEPEPAVQLPAEMPLPKLEPNADVIYCKFLHEMMDRTAKMDLSKAEAELKELAKLPDYAAAQSDIKNELKDLAAAVIFETEALKRLGGTGTILEFTAEVAKRHRLPASKGKIVGYEPGRGIELQVTGGGFYVPAAALAIDDIIKNASDASDLGKLRYVTARAVPSMGGAWLMGLKSPEKERWERKLRLMDAAEAELMAQTHFEHLKKSAEAKSWKTFDTLLLDFEKKYAATAAAKNNDGQIKEWKLAALAAAAAAAGAPADAFHASFVKHHKDGFIEVVYEFDNPDHLKDFECPDAKLFQELGCLNVPPGGGEFRFAKYKFPIAELRALQVIGRSNHGKAKHRRLRLIFMGPDTPPDREMQVLLRQDSGEVTIENMGPRSQTRCDLRLEGDTEIAAQAENGELKWSVGGRDAGRSQSSNLGGRYLALSGAGGNHSWSKLRMVFKPGKGAEAAKSTEPAAQGEALTGEIEPGLFGEVYEFKRAVNNIPDVPADMKPADKRIDAQIDFKDARNSLFRDRQKEQVYVRWTGLLKVDDPGKYTLILVSDDGSRLTVNGRAVIDMNQTQGMTDKQVEVELKKGYNDIRIDYFNAAGDAGVRLFWKLKVPEPIPAANLFHVRR
ncbi:MAG TPA: protein kinase, partial [Planctomycetota bacterium]|nr:protein kinase [Planctomycetota bacterium]